MQKVVAAVSFLILTACLSAADEPAVEKSNFPARLSGIVPVSCQPEIPHDADPTIDAMLERYREKKLSPFDWQMKLKGVIGGLPVYGLTFPSPVKTDAAVNNTVYCEYYQAAAANGKRPAIIVLHILNGNFFASRALCCLMAAKGYDALLVKLPYYGERRPAGMSNPLNNAKKPDELCDFITQGIMDIRRAKAWLLSRSDIDPGRIGIIGLSLGGFATAITCGVDAGFKRAATIVSGGMLADVVSTPSGPAWAYLQTCRRCGVTGERLRKMLEPFEPLTYAGRMAKTQLMMFNGTQDGIVPPRCAKRLADATGAFQIWYPGGHLYLVQQISQVANLLNRHFSGDDWSAPSVFFEKNSRYGSKQVWLANVLKKS